jgi:cytochrome c553
MQKRATFLTALAAAMGAVLVLSGSAFAQVVDSTTPLAAEDVANTKHNFFINQDVMFSQQNTTEICVFCHTPHGGRPSDLQTAVPLWNRAMPPSAPNTFTMYNSPNFDAFVTGAQPQGVSLACLSCHDGTIGIDSLINAPGSGGFLAANKGTGNTSLQFHSQDTLGVEGPLSAEPGSMTGDNNFLRPDCVPGDTASGGNCFQWPMVPQTNAQFFAAFNAVGATFSLAPFPNLTRDLSDDHPISMQIPLSSVDPQFTKIQNAGKFTDFANYNSKADGSGVTFITKTTTINDDVRDRIRAYPTGGAGTQFVECASCHNPHTPRPLFLRLPSIVQPDGVTGTPLPSGGGSTTWGAAQALVPGDAGYSGSFVSNNPNFQSAICLSCHEK